jgi:hypothetical protein
MRMIALILTVGIISFFSFRSHRSSEVSPTIKLAASLTTQKPIKTHPHVTPPASHSSPINSNSTSPVDRPSEASTNQPNSEEDYHGEVIYADVINADYDWLGHQWDIRRAQLYEDLEISDEEINRINDIVKFYREVNLQNFRAAQYDQYMKEHLSEKYTEISQIENKKITDIIGKEKFDTMEAEADKFLQEVKPNLHGNFEYGIATF